MTTNVLISILIIVIILAGIILLQIFLSKRQSKWPGLILPGINFCISIFAVLGMAVYTTTTSQTQTISMDGKVVNEVINHVQNNNANVGSAILTVIVVLLIYNIPTAVLLAIYAACRENLKKNQELDKMNIQDL